jgi:hypothetical protein
MQVNGKHLPLWRISLLLHLCKHTFRLIINTMRASWQLSVALNFLLPTHIAGSCDPPPFRLITVIEQRVRVSKHLRRHIYSPKSIIAVATEDLWRRLVVHHRRRRHRVAMHVVELVHGCKPLMRRGPQQLENIILWIASNESGCRRHAVAFS